MKFFLSLLFSIFTVIVMAQAPLFRVDGTLKNKNTGKPEAGVKIEIVQNGSSLFSGVTASTGKYDVKGAVDYTKPFKVVYSKSGFVSKSVSFDYTKMNLEDAPPGDLRPPDKLDTDMIPSDPAVDLSFLESEPAAKFYWDVTQLKQTNDIVYNEKIRLKVEKILADAAKNKTVDEAKYQALIAEADGLYNQQKWEEARAKYEAALAIKPMEKHPNARLIELDALIMAKKKEDLANQQANSEYDNLITAADALRDQKKYEQAILKYEEALRLKDEDYPRTQAANLKKLVEDDKKYKEAVSQADMFYNQRSYQAAKDKYTVANKLKPQEPHPIARLAEIEKKQNELNAANEKKKKYEEAVAAADGLFEGQKYEEAKLKYQEALTYETSATYPEERILACNKFIADAAAEKQKQEKIAKLLEEGNTLFTASKWTEAKVKYNEVIVVDPNNEIAKASLTEIDQKIAEANDKAAQDAKFQKLVTEGDIAAKATKYSDAVLKYEEAIKIKADPAVQTKLDDAKKKIQELEDKAALEKKFQDLKDEGIQLATDQKWLDAKSKLKEAQTIKSTDAEVNKKLAEVEAKIQANEAMLKLDKEYEDLMAAAEQKASADDYDGAIAKFKEASLKKPAEQLPKTRILELEELKKNNAKLAATNAEFNALMKAGKDLMAAQKYLEAIKEFNKANTLKPEEKEPVDLAAECERLEKAKGNEEDVQFEKMLSVAQSKLDEKDYIKARELADRAMKFRPADPRPKELLAKITEEETIEKNYSAKMLEAEKQVAEKNYQKAIAFFEQAKGIKPVETKPQERIDDVNKLIADASSAAEKEQLYKDFMDKGFLSEKAKTWDQALINYQNALNVKPGDKPAQDKIAEMQQIIDDLANASKNEQEKQDRFNKLIQEADNLFTAEDYLGAKGKYEEALNVIPGNSYAAKQVEECIRRERSRSTAEEEKEYQKIITKADENFNGKEYEKARDYYTRATTIRPADPHPIERLKEIENILNPPVLGSVELKPLGEPFPENSIMDGYAALVQADIERKNLKDKKVEDVVSNAVQKEEQMGAIAGYHQAETTNEIYRVTSSIEQYTVDSDDNRKAVVEALRRADDEAQLVAYDEVTYKQADLLKAQDKLDVIEDESEIDYSARESVYKDNTDLLHSYAGSLRVELEERNMTDNNKNITADQNLGKIEINMEGISVDNTVKQKKNDLIIENAVVATEDLGEQQNTNKTRELLDNNAQLTVVNIGVAERQENDAKNAPANDEKLKGVESIVQDAEKVRADAAGVRTTDNTSAMGGITIELEQDYSDRDINRKENVELVKENELALNEGKREKLEAENLKYLKNKSEIDNEDLKKKDIVDKDDQQVSMNLSGVETLNIQATDRYEQRGMTDDDQRQRARAGVEIISANAEEYNGNSTKKQENNAYIVDDLNKTIEADASNKSDTKQEELYSAQAQIEKIDAEKPVKPRIKNALGEEYPEGVSQESFTQNDENGLMKAIITRRVVVTNGEGNVYVRTQTLYSVTYSKNDRPITEHQWNKETTGPHLQKNY